MIIVLDSNEYINHINKRNLLDKLFSDENISICINDHITREVVRNLNEHQRKEFYNIILGKNIEFYSQKLPLSSLDRFKKIGLKKGDIAIAAFCDYIGADYLISENRHFLKSRKFDKFRVVSLREFAARDRNNFC